MINQDYGTYILWYRKRTAHFISPHLLGTKSQQKIDGAETPPRIPFDATQRSGDDGGRSSQRRSSKVLRCVSLSTLITINQTGIDTFEQITAAAGVTGGVAEAN